MPAPGQLALWQMPYTSARTGKTRPVLLLKSLPGIYDDWLVRMVSTNLVREIVGFDEVVRTSDPDFSETGLKKDSVIRIGRLAVADGSQLQGSIGVLPSPRFEAIQRRLSDWLSP